MNKSVNKYTVMQMCTLTVGQQQLRGHWQPPSYMFLHGEILFGYLDDQNIPNMHHCHIPGGCSRGGWIWQAQLHMPSKQMCFLTSVLFWQLGKQIHIKHVIWSAQSFSIILLGMKAKRLVCFWSHRPKQFDQQAKPFFHCKASINASQNHNFHCFDPYMLSPKVDLNNKL